MFEKSTPAVSRKSNVRNLSIFSRIRCAWIAILNQAKSQIRNKCSVINLCGRSPKMAAHSRYVSCRSKIKTYAISNVRQCKTNKSLFNREINDTIFG